MLTFLGADYQQGQRIYAPSDVAARLRISGPRVRQLAAVYERVYGDLPRNERGRVWPEEAVERLDLAHKAVVAGRARSVEQALRVPESTAAAGVTVIDGPDAYGRLDPNVLTLLEELRRLRAAIEGMSHRLASLERGTRELHDAVRAERSLELLESPDSTEPDTPPTEPSERSTEQSFARRQYVLGTLLIALALLAVEGMNWLNNLFRFGGFIEVLTSFNLPLFISVIGPFTLACFIGFRGDQHLSWRFLARSGVVVALVVWIVAYFATEAFEVLTRLVYLISGSAKLGAGLRRWESLERFMGFDTTTSLIGVGIISAGAYVMFLSGGALGNALRGRHVPAPQLRPRENRAASTEWGPKKQAYLAFAGTVLGSVLSLIETIVTVAASG